MSANRILIDTSVWIDYLQEASTGIAGKVEDMISNHIIFVPKIVIAELIQGASSIKEISVIEDFTEAFNIIDQADDTWVDAGRLSYNLKKKGKTVNLSDCYIASIAFQNNCHIFTLDKHFKDIQKILSINLINI